MRTVVDTSRTGSGGVEFEAKRLRNYITQYANPRTRQATQLFIYSFAVKKAENGDIPGNQTTRNMKNSGLALKRIGRAAKKAHDNGLMGKEVYDSLVDAGIEDMRYDAILGWKDAVLVSAEPAAPTAEEDTGATLTLLSRPSKTVTQAEKAQGSPTTNREADKSTSGSGGQASIAGIEVDSFDAEAEAQQAEGYGFVWCLDCGRVDRAKYGNKTLPEYFKGKESEGEGECGIVLILCGNCRRTLGRVGPAKADLEHNMVSRFTGLRLRPRMLEGSEAVQAVKAAMKREVKILTDQGGVAYRDVDKIITKLEAEDQLASVDLERFRQGKRDRLILPYLRGGLISWQ